MYTGPKLHNDNLAFGYDTGYGLDQHSSTRHYKGEPATNLITAGIPGYFGSGGETLYQDKYLGLNSDSGVFQRNFVNNPAQANTSTYNNNAGLYKNFTTSALSSSTEYILVSFDFYMIENYVRHSSSGTGLNGYMGVTYTDGSSDNLSWNTSLNTPNAGDDWNNNSAYIGQWRKIALYVQVNSSKTPSVINAMYIYNDRTITGEGVFTNFIITEHATAPTAPVLYTSSTRSNTASLIDLKRTATINMNTMSFDSTGQPTFDGTDDRISSVTGIGITDYSQPFTMECVFMVPTGATWANAYRSNIFSIAGGYAGHYGFYKDGTDGVGFQIRDASSGAYPATTGLLRDTYYHITAVFQGGSGLTLYRNGVSVSTSTTSFTGAPDTPNLYIGGVRSFGGGGGTWFQGEIPVAKYYNQALSAQEVQQNYNAYKNRFNI